MKNQDKKYNTFQVQAPSNIAFVKYWGKHGRQLPMNPSLSMTLSSCKTVTQFEYAWGADSLDHSQTLFEGDHSLSFHARLNRFLCSITDLYPELDQLSLKISSHNTFPHSAGIASSASAYGAIGLGLARIISEKRGRDFDIYQEASIIARLGSGSASRSIKGPFVRWGIDDQNKGSDHFAQAISSVHSSFNKLYDCILLVDSSEKSVSSSAGHELMNKHAFKDSRNKQANEHFQALLIAMESGDFEAFGEILEAEALTLHALMMSSNPSYILLHPNSLEIIARVRMFRGETHTPLYFTIDAGPNIHLIYPESAKLAAENFINSELRSFCVADCLFDHAGSGAIINE